LLNKNATSMQICEWIRHNHTDCSSFSLKAVKVLDQLHMICDFASLNRC